ncbi:hypothetical protein Q5M60_12175 [Acinetobacter baumannii]|nr:hypothetical protein [Acinetobacter baumannii]
MKKLLPILISVFISYSVHAGTNLQEVKVNCDDVKLSLNTAIDNKLNFGAYWNDSGVFPNPPKYTEIGDSIRSKVRRFKVTCPDFSASYDGNMAEIKAKDYVTVLSKFSEYDTEPSLFNISGYKYPNIRKGFFSSNYSINLRNFNFKTSIYEMSEGKDLNEELLKYISVQKDSVIGYKVDGGELKPLLYDRKMSNYKQDFSEAKTIDIFHKISSSNVGVTIQRIFIDKDNGILRIYAKSPFPNK